MRKRRYRVLDKMSGVLRMFGTDRHDDIRINDRGNAFYYNMSNGDGSSSNGDLFDPECGYVLMEDTGVLDVEANPIFEGDFVQSFEEKEKWLVFFEDGGHQLFQMNKTSSQEDDLSVKIPLCQKEVQERNLKICGNIGDFQKGDQTTPFLETVLFLKEKK